MDPLDTREARDLVTVLHRLLEEGEPLARDFRAVAEINDAFVRGNQYGGVTYKDNQVVVTKDDWFDDEDVPRVHVNVLGNYVATLVSLITKDRPCAVARPLSDESVDAVYEAGVSNLLIRYLSQELKTVEVVQRGVMLAEKHGWGGIKAWFNQQTRKAEICPVSLFNVTIDPQGESVDDAQWFIFHRWLRKAEAMKLVEPMGVRKVPAEKSYDTSSGIKKRGVPAHELWIRPGYDDAYPRGCYAFIVDGIVVERTEYPLIVEDDTGPQSLPPLVGIVAKPIDECVFGHTAVTDTIPLQRHLNEATSRIVKYLRIDSSPKLLYPDLLPEGVDPYTDAKIPFPATAQGVAAAAAMKWLQGPGVPQEAFELRDFFIKQIGDILGVSPLTAGTQTRSVSGRALEQIAGLDEQKNSQTTRSIETGVLMLYRILLAIMQLNYDDRAKLDIAGSSAAEVMLFNKADIMGKNIRLEPASEFDLMQPTEEQSALERAQSGLGSATDVRTAARNPRTAYSRQLAERLVQEMLAGHDVELSADDIDHDAFFAVIDKHKRLAMLEGRRSDYATLVEFEKFVDSLASATADTTPAPDAADQQQPQQAAPATPPAPTEGPIQ